MRITSPIVRIAWLMAIAMVSFGAGVLFEYLRGPLDGLLATAGFQVGPRAEPTGEHQARSTTSLDTVLLPLTKTTVAIPRESGIRAGLGGGLTVIQDRIVIGDVFGSFVAVQPGHTAAVRLPLPPLPNRVDEFHRSKASQREGGGFGVHDVASLTDGSSVRLFVSHETFLPKEDTTALAVSSIRLSQNTLLPLGNWEDVYRGQPLRAEKYSGYAGGGRLLVNDGTLYLTVGDYNQDNVFMKSGMEAQNPRTDFGKILAIDLNAGTTERVSTGHRNPEGLLVTSRGELLATDHGPRGGDALERVGRGENFGWPVTTLGTNYDTYSWPNREDTTTTAAFEPPIFAWLPSIAISNLIEVANFHRAWNGDLLIGSLKAQSLHRVRRDASGRVLYVEPIWIGERLRDIAGLSDGTIALWTDAARLVLLAVDRPRLSSNARHAPTLNPPALEPCLGCHHSGPTNATHAAPSLSNVLGRQIASDSFDRYSDGLKQLSGVWTKENLVAFLRDASAFAHGGGMAHRVRSRREAVQIVELLANME